LAQAQAFPNEESQTLADNDSTIHLRHLHGELNVLEPEPNNVCFESTHSTRALILAQIYNAYPTPTAAPVQPQEPTGRPVAEGCIELVVLQLQILVNFSHEEEKKREVNGH